MGKEVAVGAANFAEEVLNSEIPVLVDFWAPWCGPCHSLGPILEALSEEYEGRLKIAKINVDEEGELAGENNIISIPTLMVFNKGVMVKQQTGAGSKQAVIDFFKDYI